VVEPEITSRLNSRSRVALDIVERGIVQAELRDPRDVFRSSSRGSSSVCKIRPDFLSGRFPGKVEDAAGSGERCSNVGDGVGKTRRSWVVGDVQSREIIPQNLGILCRAALDVRRKQGPCHTLRDRRFEPNRDGEETRELAESELLTTLGSDGLKQRSGRGSVVEMPEKAVYTRFATASDLLVEVDPVEDSGEIRVGVCASRGGKVGTAHESRDEELVADLLLLEKLNEGSVIRSEACVDEVLLAEER